RSKNQNSRGSLLLPWVVGSSKATNHLFTMSKDPAAATPEDGSCQTCSLCATLRSTPTEEWWSQTGSNRRPHACKARALPTELWPLEPARLGGSEVRSASPEMVGPGRLELPTLRLSGVRSNHLSYRPMAAAQATHKRPGLAIAPRTG